MDPLSLVSWLEISLAMAKEMLRETHKMRVRNSVRCVTEVI
jgi:hypothetical protein